MKSNEKVERFNQIVESKIKFWFNLFAVYVLLHLIGSFFFFFFNTFFNHNISTLLYLISSNVVITLYGRAFIVRTLYLDFVNKDYNPDIAFLLVYGLN